MSTSGSTNAPDFTRPALKPSERKAIVEYVLNTAGLQETDYLEWKSGYDLSTKPGSAATAKQLIGFANRDIASAARHAGGYGYLLLGVEPGTLHGVPSWDSADVENWLSPFLQAELRYDVHPVELGGKNVLFLIVDPPRQGDPIFSLQRASSDPGGNAMPSGTIYVRRTGKTSTHDAADLGRLSARSQPVGTELQLALEADDSRARALDPHLLSNEFRDSFLDDRRRALLAALPEPDPFHGYAFAALRPGGELRSVEEYRAEVEAFVTKTKERWGNYVAYEELLNEPASLTLTVINHTDENYEDVVVEARLPVGQAMVHASTGGARRILNPAREPAVWGTSYAQVLARQGDVDTLDAVGIAIEKVKDLETLVRFPPMHVRPRTSHELPALLLALPPAYADAEMPVQWRATARNTRGDLGGAVRVQIASGTKERPQTGEPGAAEEEAPEP